MINNTEIDTFRFTRDKILSIYSYKDGRCRFPPKLCNIMNSSLNFSNKSIKYFKHIESLEKRGAMPKIWPKKVHPTLGLCLCKEKCKGDTGSDISKYWLLSEKSIKMHMRSPETLC